MASIAYIGFAIKVRKDLIAPEAVRIKIIVRVKTNENFDRVYAY